MFGLHEVSLLPQCLDCCLILDCPRAAEPTIAAEIARSRTGPCTSCTARKHQLPTITRIRMRSTERRESACMSRMLWLRWLRLQFSISFISDRELRFRFRFPLKIANRQLVWDVDSQWRSRNKLSDETLKHAKMRMRTSTSQIANVRLLTRDKSHELSASIKKPEQFAVETDQGSRGTLRLQRRS